MRTLVDTFFPHAAHFIFTHVNVWRTLFSPGRNLNYFLPSITSRNFPHRRTWEKCHLDASQSNHNLRCLSVCLSVYLSRPNISQFCSLKIRRTTILNYIKFANLLISKLKNCETFGQGWLWQIEKEREKICFSVIIILFSEMQSSLIFHSSMTLKITVMRTSIRSWIPLYRNIISIRYKRSQLTNSTGKKISCANKIRSNIAHDNHKIV